MPAIAKEFKVHSKTQLALPISIYLIGYAVGPIICGPLSERYGRKPVTLSAFMSFMAFMCGCAVCQNWVSLLVLRFFLGLVASAPVAIIGGLFADICDDPRERGRVIAYYMTVTLPRLLKRDVQSH